MVTGMETISPDVKYQQLKRYSQKLKFQLKEHAGKSFTKGSPLESKLQAYKKIKKLLQYYSESKDVRKDVKLLKQLNNYYDIFSHKCTKSEEKLSKKSTSVSKARESTQERAKQTREQVKQPNPVVEETRVETDDDSEEEITEVGPTPQLNGRVLTIFDIQTSPEKYDMSPIKGSKQPNLLDINIDLPFGGDDNDDDGIFKTPSKPASKNLKDISLHSTLATTTKKLNFEEAVPLRGDVTPKKTVQDLQLLMETPKYLKSQTLGMNNIDEMIINEEWSEDDSDFEYDFVSNEVGVDGEDDELLKLQRLGELPDLEEELNLKLKAEPSPLIKRTGRSLFQLHSDLSGLKKNLTGLQSLLGEVDEEPADLDGISEINDHVENQKENDTAPEKDEKEDELSYVYDPHAKLRNKMKTMKRSTRRSRLKTESLNYKDEFDKFDIHALATGKNQCEKVVEETPVDEGNDSNQKRNHFDMEDQDSDDDDYERKDLKQLQSELGTSKNKGKHPLSNNFVRLKINMGNRGGRFKRRR